MSAAAVSTQSAGVTASRFHPQPGDGLGLRFQNVYKRFGTMFALRDVSIEIAPGEFVALLGPNGSGKTTLLRVAALLSKPTSGRLRLTGAGSNAKQDWRHAIGFVGHQSLLYDELTAAENLRLFARLYGVWSDPLLEQWLGAANLWSRRNDLVHTYSRGMRQRLSVVRALLHNPRLLLLDEPATGLDRESTRWLADILAGLKAAGRTVLASTHSSELIRELASRTIVLRAGSVVENAPGYLSTTGRV